MRQDAGEWRARSLVRRGPQNRVEHGQAENIRQHGEDVSEKDETKVTSENVIAAASVRC